MTDFTRILDKIRVLSCPSIFFFSPLNYLLPFQGVQLWCDWQQLDIYSALFCYYKNVG